MTPDCSNHKKEVAGVSDMKVLAEMIEDLQYEEKTLLFHHLWMLEKKRSESDKKDGKKKLSRALKMASLSLLEATKHFKDAMDISKPFMNPNTKQ